LKSQNALAETINGRHDAEVIHRHRSWRTMEDVEWETRSGSIINHLRSFVYFMERPLYKET